MNIMVSTLHDPFDRPLTHRDLDHTPDDGNRYELVSNAIPLAKLWF